MRSKVTIGKWEWRRVCKERCIQSRFEKETHLKMAEYEGLDAAALQERSHGYSS